MFKKFIHTHYHIGILLGIALILFVGLSFFEMNRLLTGPELSLVGVTDGSTLSEPLVSITGTAKHGTKIILNGAEKPAPIDGSFSYDILLASGFNFITIETQDARGKSASKNLSVVLREVEDGYVLGPIKKY